MAQRTDQRTPRRLTNKLHEERRKLRRMKNLGVPMDRVNVHYQAVRAGLKKGTRSDLVKMDRYFKELFTGEQT